MNDAQSVINRAMRRQNTDPQVLYQRIERRLHTMHLSARKASLLAGLPPDGIRTIARGRIPRADKMKALAEGLKVDLNWFNLPETAIDAAISGRAAPRQPKLELPASPVNPGSTKEGA